MKKTKYYSVNVYDVKYDHCYGAPLAGALELIDSIIVKKGLLHAEELLTKHPIDIVPTHAIEGNKLRNEFWDEPKFQKCGHHLIISKGSLRPYNIVTDCDINSYIDKYEQSNFKNVYDSIQQTKNTSKLLKRLRGSKK